jgi:serine/threonine protein kinase
MAAPPPESANPSGISFELLEEGLRGFVPSGPRGLDRQLGLDRVLMAMKVAEKKAIRIGRYLVKRRLGRGGMGSVYEARDPELQRDVAIKLLHREVTAEDTELFREEAKALAGLAHPNVVMVYDIGVTNEQLYVAMQYVAGMDLRRRLMTSPGLSRKEALAIFIEAGRGLAAAHAAGIIHRDFKPENVLVGDDGRIMLADFGLARRTGHQQDRAEVVGTFEYMPPEVQRGASADARSDQYSFCASVWKMLDPTTKPGTPSPVIDEFVARVLTRGLAPDPGDRWSGMDVLLGTLEQSVDQRPRERQRAILLDRAAHDFSTGVLRKSLDGGALLERPMAAAHEKVHRPWSTLLPMSDGVSHDTSDLGSQLEVGNGSLLILGQPGAGKTTSLLMLAESLTRAARLDRRAPAPVVLKLATFARYPGSLRAWLENELVAKYSVAGRMVQAWLDDGELAVLLDGLDEINRGRRRHCIAAINAFRAEYPMPIVVTCRTDDYETIGTRLAFGAAIEVLPRSSSNAETAARLVDDASLAARLMTRPDEDVDRLLRDARPERDAEAVRARGLARVLSGIVEGHSTLTPGRYVLEEKIGDRGSGALYRAYDSELHRTILLQLLSANDAERDALMRQAKLLAALEHPSVVAVYDVGRAGHDLYLAMEHVPGVTLETWLRARPDAPWKEVVELFVQAGRGLAAMLDAGVRVHGFHLGDVVIRDDGRVRVRGLRGTRGVDGEPDDNPVLTYLYTLDDILRRKQTAGAIRLPRGLRQLIRPKLRGASSSYIELDPFLNALEKLLDPAAEDRDRSLLLERVNRFWVEGALATSLGPIEPVPLWIRGRPETLAADSTDSAMKLPDHASTEDLPELLDDTTDRLLLLGAAGSGKTTSLLRLAHHLIEVARSDLTQPAPVVLNLASWSTDRPPIERWVEDEILTKYSLPRPSTRGWIERGQLVLLLDGLDEVVAVRRSACVDAINDFLETAKVQIVVGTREDEYLACRSRLRLPLAVSIDPLDDIAVDGMVEELGERAHGLREAMNRTPELLEHARSPLVLGMLAIVGAEAPGNPDHFRHALYERFVDSVFRRRASHSPYAREKMLDGLHWLAGAMRRTGLAQLWPERLQREIFESRWQRLAALGIGVLLLLMVTIAVTMAVLSAGSDWSLVLGVGAALGGVAAAHFGVIAAAMHIGVRTVMAVSTPVPLRLRRFLDYAVERALLRRVGGGYIFVHRALMDHFADRRD